MCIDYRQLNLRTIKDSYALPRLEDITDNFVGCDFFSSLDMRSGYFQVEVNEADKAKTAFTTGPMGFYEFVRMPFELCNAPAKFQRLMEHCMGDLYMKCYFAYIDDINVPSAGFDQGLQRLEQVFQKLRLHNFKINPDKCQFFRSKLLFCGHVISNNGIETNPSKPAK